MQKMWSAINTKMTEQELTDLQKLCDAAFPEPWKWDINGENFGSIVYGEKYRICDCYEITDAYSQNFEHDKANAKLIAASRTALPKFIATVRKYREALECIEDIGNTIECEGLAKIASKALEES